MPITFGNLSQVFVNRLCSHLDNDTILNMRQVSKSTKERVDFSILSARGTVLKQLCFERENGKIQIKLSIEQQKRWDFCLWKSCIKSITKMLGMPKFLFRESKDCHGIMDLEETIRFLEFLKPFIRRTEFTNIAFAECPRDIVNKCATILSGKSISNLAIKRRSFSARYDFSPFIQFIEYFKPDNLDLSIHNFGNSSEGRVKDSVAFALKLADLVRSLSIDIEDENSSYPNIALFIRDLLSRKCEKLEISLYTRNQISLTDVENILQFLHYSSKKVVLETWTSADPMNVVCGVYRVETWDTYRRGITIKHLDMK